MLYPTMMFRLNGVDPDAAGEAWKTIPALMEEAEKRGVHFPRKGAIVRPMKHETEWRVNVTQLKTGNGRAIDGTDARELSAGEIEGRRQALAFFEFLQSECARLRLLLCRRYPAAARHPRNPPRSPAATA